jgi:hypothetical protein
MSPLFLFSLSLASSYPARSDDFRTLGNNADLLISAPHSLLSPRDSDRTHKRVDTKSCAYNTRLEIGSSLVMGSQIECKYIVACHRARTRCPTRIPAGRAQVLHGYQDGHPYPQPVRVGVPVADHYLCRPQVLLTDTYFHIKSVLYLLLGH